jgi:hypothetical protein
MIMSAVEFQRIAATEHSVRERIEQANQPAPAPAARGPAEVIPFPVTRCRHIVDRALHVVRDYAADGAYRQLTAVARQHRSRLRKIGVDAKRIEADVHALENAFGLHG